MTKLLWDQVGEREYESGIDKGVLYIPDNTGDYTEGYAWNGLTTVTETPSGATPTPKYADNLKYLNLISIEEFAGEIEAYTYPDEFAQCDGSAAPTPGIYVGQQSRHSFGLAYRTLIGNDLEALDFGYKIHLVYGALAEPSQKAFTSVNATPDAIALKWKFSTTPVDVPGLKPSATIVIDSTKVSTAGLTALEAILYGSVGVDARLPLPAEVFALFEGTITTVTPVAPSFDSGTHVITIPTVTGVIYKINGVVKAAGALPAITTDTVVTAEPAVGYEFPAVTDNDWFYSAS